MLNICVISNDNAELIIFENQIGGYLRFNVNLNEVAEFRSNQLVICNGDKIPCSRANQKAVKNAFEVLQERRKNS